MKIWTFIALWIVMTVGSYALDQEMFTPQSSPGKSSFLTPHRAFREALEHLSNLRDVSPDTKCDTWEEAVESYCLPPHTTPQGTRHYLPRHLLTEENKKRMKNGKNPLFPTPNGKHKKPSHAHHVTQNNVGKGKGEVVVHIPEDVHRMPGLHIVHGPSKVNRGAFKASRRAALKNFARKITLPTVIKPAAAKHAQRVAAVLVRKKSSDSAISTPQRRMRG